MLDPVINDSMSDHRSSAVIFSRTRLPRKAAMPAPNDLVTMIRQTPAVAGIVGVIIGAVLTKLVPYFWSGILNFGTWILGRFGGRLAHRHLEKQLMNWTVMQMRELKLTGIVSSDNAKKPTLEQVFVSLRLAEQHNNEAIDDLALLLRKLGLPLPRSSDQLEELQFLKNHLTGLDLDDLISLERLTAKRLNSQEHREMLEGVPFFRYLLYQLWCIGNRIKEILVPGLVTIIRGERTKTLFLVVRIRWRAEALLRAIKLNDNLDANAAVFKRILRHTPRLAILGSPGAGKTTLLQYVALAYARARAGDPRLHRHATFRRQLGADKWRLPIYVPLGTIASFLADLEARGEAPSLVKVLPKLMDPELRREYEKIAQSYYQRRVARGKCIFLLDGLDEVPTEQDFARVVTSIESLAIQYPENQFIVTSRVVGWRSGIEADFRKYYVNDLTDRQVESFVDTWYEAVERNAVIGALRDEGIAERRARVHRATTKAGELKTALHSTVGIRKLATNPMLLSIVAMVHRSLATLPRERAKLYDQCTRVLLEQWDISRGVRVDDTGLKLEQKEAIMRRLAAAMHGGEIGEPGGAREAPRQRVEEIIAALLPGMGRSGDQSGQLLQRLMERSGLIVERRRDVLGFAHLTFQEYFAAQSLLASPAAEAIKFLTAPEVLFRDWWREVLLLYSGLQPDSSALIAAVLQDLTDRREERIQLASQCFWEAVQVGDAPVRSTLELLLLEARLRTKVIAARPLPVEVREYLVQWVNDRSLHSLSTAENPVQSESSHDLAWEDIEIVNAWATSSSASVEERHNDLSGRELSRSQGGIAKQIRTLSMSPDWRHRQSAAKILQDMQPSADVISALGNLAGDPDPDVRETAISSIKERAQQSLSLVDEQINQLFENTSRTAQITALRLLAAVGKLGASPERSCKVLDLLAAKDREVQSAAEEAFCASATDAATASLLCHYVESGKIPTKLALRLSAKIVWDLESHPDAAIQLRNRMNAGGAESFVPATVLVWSENQEIRRQALQKIVSGVRRGSVRLSLLRSAANGRRGDLDCVGARRLYPFLGGDGVSTAMASICLGRLSSCTDCEYTIRVLKNRMFLPTSIYFGLLPYRTLTTLLSLRLEQTFREYNLTTLLDSDLRHLGGVPIFGEIAGLAELGSNCCAERVAEVLRWVLVQAPRRWRHPAAHALSLLPLASTEEAYALLFSFYTKQFQRVSTEDLEIDDLAYSSTFDNHPLVRVALRLPAEVLEKNVIELLSNANRALRACAAMMIASSERQWDLEVYSALAEAILGEKYTWLVVLLLKAGQALLGQDDHPRLLSAISTQLRSEAAEAREIAWTITSSACLRLGHWRTI